MLNQKSLTILSLLLFVFLAFSCESAKTAKNQEFTLLSVKMEAVTRGNSKTINVDEYHTTIDKATLGEESMMGRNQNKAEVWNNIVQLVSKIDLNEFENFEAPTQDRLFDGARATVISLKLKDKTLTSQAFDEGKPPAQLKDLYDYLVSLENQ